MHNYSFIEQKEVRMINFGFKKWLTVLVAAPVLMTSCQRDDEEQILEEAQDINPEQATMVEEMEKAQSLFFDATEQASYASGLEEASSADCFKTTYNEEQGNMKFVVSFGSKGCEDKFGVKRSGIITVSSRTTDKGLEMSYNLDKYAVNGYTLSGTVAVSGLKRDENNMLSYQYKVEDGKVNTPKGKSYLVSRDLKFTQAGSPTSSEYMVTGGSSVLNAEGIEYTSDIIKPAKFKASCFGDGNYYPLEGALQVDFETGKYFTVDFGAGGCDKTANIMAGTKQLAIQLQ